MAKDHGSGVKDDRIYEELREDGASKEKAARIANAKAGGEDVGKKGGEGESYEDRTVDELRDRAAEIGIEGRSKMDKGELIDALRTTTDREGDAEAAGCRRAGSSWTGSSSAACVVHRRPPFLSRAVWSSSRVSSTPHTTESLREGIIDGLLLEATVCSSRRRSARRGGSFGFRAEGCGGQQRSAYVRSPRL